MRQDIRSGNTTGAQSLQRDINADQNGIARDRQDLNNDQRDLRQDMSPGTGTPSGGFRR